MCSCQSVHLFTTKPNMWYIPLYYAGMGLEGAGGGGGGGGFTMYIGAECGGIIKLICT